MRPQLTHFVAGLTTCLSLLLTSGAPNPQPQSRPILPASLTAPDPEASTILPIGLSSAGSFIAPLPPTSFRPSTEFGLTLWEVPPSKLPSTADSNSPAFWDGNDLVVFSSAEWPVRHTGSNNESLKLGADVTCLGCDRPGGRWIEAVWQDPSSKLLYGWYHFEPSDLPCQTAPIIGAAISRDGGKTWVDQGPVLENGYGIDCAYDNGFFVGGNGDFHVIPDQHAGYFYFVFSNYAGPIEQQGVALARSSFKDRGQPRTAFKLHNGAWTEPGLGGQVSPIFTSTTGWKGPHIEAFWGPSIHWNDYLDTYVALLNHTDGPEWKQEGIYLSTSANLLEWTEPQKILDTDSWYPQILGSGPRGTDTLAGKTSRLYLGGHSTYALEFTLPSVASAESSDI